MSEPSESSDDRRWYNPKLPSWFPAWFFACSLVGISAAATFAYGLDVWDLTSVAMFFVAGFGFALLILTATHYQFTRTKTSPQEHRSSSFFPPYWVRHPVVVLLVVMVGAGMVERKTIRLGRHPSRVIMERPVVVALGFAVMAGASYRSVRMVARRASSCADRYIGVSGIVIVAAGIIGSAFRLAAPYFPDG